MKKIYDGVMWIVVIMLGLVIGSYIGRMFS